MTEYVSYSIYVGNPVMKNCMCFTTASCACCSETKEIFNGEESIKNLVEMANADYQYAINTKILAWGIAIYGQEEFLSMIEKCEKENKEMYRYDVLKHFGDLLTPLLLVLNTSLFGDLK